jgi:hypothetical protein
MNSHNRVLVLSVLVLAGLTSLRLANVASGRTMTESPLQSILPTPNEGPTRTRTPIAPTSAPPPPPPPTQIAPSSNPTSAPAPTLTRMPTVRSTSTPTAPAAQISRLAYCGSFGSNAWFEFEEPYAGIRCVKPSAIDTRWVADTSDVWRDNLYFLSVPPSIAINAPFTLSIEVDQALIPSCGSACRFAVRFYDGIQGRWTPLTTTVAANRVVLAPIFARPPSAGYPGLPAAMAFELTINSGPVEILATPTTSPTPSATPRPALGSSTVTSQPPSTPFAPMPTVVAPVPTAFAAVVAGGVATNALGGVLAPSPGLSFLQTITIVVALVALITGVGIVVSAIRRRRPTVPK